MHAQLFPVRRIPMKATQTMKAINASGEGKKTSRGKNELKGGLAKPVRDAKRDLRTGLEALVGILRVVLV